MKKYKIISKYPFATIGIIAALVLLSGPIIFSIIVALIIVVPLYLAVQIFGDNE